MSDTRSHPIRFTARAVATGRMRNEIRVDWPAMGQSWEFATDEAPALGGEDTAPPPLAFLAVALVGCAMTNIRMMARRFGVEIRDLRVGLAADWRREVAPGQPHTAATDGFALEIALDSPAPAEAVRALVQAARAGCFVEHSLGNAVPVSARLRHGSGDWIALPGPAD